MKHIKFSQTGDTIVEVLIVVSVLAATLTGAYAVANRSNKGVQANKERYQAQLIANSQAERLRSTINSGTNRSVYNGWSSVKGCIKGDGIPPIPLSDCKTNDGDVFGNSGLYSVSVECLDGCAITDTYNTYKIRVEWDSILGGDPASGKDNVELYYGV